MAPPTGADITVDVLDARDLAATDAVFRVAFGTALGLREPERFVEGAEIVRSRWHGDHVSAFKADAGGELVGCAFVTRWGSYAVFGPLAVHPDHWNRGIARLLWQACIPRLEPAGVRHTALFTRAEPKNVHLYRGLGFHPGFLTSLMERRVESVCGESTDVRALASLRAGGRAGAIAGCRRITDALFPGLDLEPEIRALDALALGDTLLVHEDGEVHGFALCHAGEGSEAEPRACYVKFAAVAPGAGAADRFGRMLDACEAYAARRGLERVVAGVNTARRETCRALRDRGYRTFALGVAMHRPDEVTWDRPGMYVLDDRR